MRTTFYLAVTFTLVIAIAGCNRKTVSLDYTNAKNEVPQLGNLVFRFDKSLVPDSLLDRWNSTEFISFEPKIPGRFRWDQSDQLVFSPSRPLAPATSYKATLTDELLQHSEYGRVANDEKIAFHTAPLKIENTNVAWMLQDEGSKTAVPQIDLYFNYPVNPSLLKDKLLIEVDGRQTNFNIQTLSTGNKVSVRLLNVKAEDKDYDLKIVLEKGLKPEGGTDGVTETAEVRAQIPSPFLLTVNDIAPEHDGSTGVIAVKTSQQLAGPDIASYISFSPAVKFSVELSDDGFLISSDNFDMEKTYEIAIDKGLRGKLGGVLKEAYNNQLAFGALEPSISFVNGKALYLSAQGARNIEVRVTNIPRLKLVVSKIYESNLIAAQQYGYYPQETSLGSDNGDDYYQSGVDITLGDIVYEQEIDATALPKSGGSRLLNFNITDRLPDFKGIYHIMIRSTQDYWVRDSRFISLSDIGIIVKEGRNVLNVYTNSIQASTPIDGVNLFVYGNNNQLLGTGTTDAEGMATVSYTRKEFSGFRAAMVIAKTANDFNYIPFATTRTATSRFDIGGRHGNNAGLDAFVYAERDIYRPGEQINFSVIVRDPVWKVPADMPLLMKFLLPNGKELKSFRKNLNEQGSVEGSVAIAAAAITGSYLLEVYTSNDVLLATKAFMIEEFVPDRIRVNTRLDKPYLSPGDAAKLSIQATNFFGPPAAGRNYETEIQVKQKVFIPKKYNNYDFGLANQNSFFDKLVKEGKTDENGKAEEDYQVPETYRNMGILQSLFYATVFDETGRPVSRMTSADIHTQPVFLGIGKDAYDYYPLHQAIKFPLIAIDRNEALVNGTRAEVRMIKHEYKTILSKSGSFFAYQSQKEDRLISTQTIALRGEQTAWTFVPRSPGEYELRVYLPGAGSYVSRSFYSYGSRGGDNNSFEVNREGQIDIELDKDAYLTGETVKALFKTPFSGRMLVTMETDRVVSQQYVNVDKRSASLDLKLSPEHLPNVYVTATLIKPHDVTDMPLTVAHGFQNIRVEEKARKLAVEIIAPRTVRSRTHQKVRVKAAANSFITLAAVDNGVLQVSDFKTPDPYQFFYGRKALDVVAYDIYPLLFPEVKARLSSTGGDGEAEMSKRTNPMPAKRIKILSYWSGIAKANGSGEAGFEFDIPAFSGQVRLMAIAYKDDRFGSADASVTVADPIVLSTALPRFLSPGDTVSVPVTVTNTTTKGTTASAVLKVTGPLKIVGESRQSVNLSANSEGRAVFRMVANPVVNTAKVLVEVEGLGEKFSDQTDISIRPASSLQKLSGSGSLTGNTSQRVSINTLDFMPASVNYSLVVSRSPVLQLASQLQYLVQYPYGCTEQVISAAFPQLYYGELAEQVVTTRGSVSNANSNVLEAIRKIRMRQLYNGAVMLWDNEGTENWWVTAYAGQFLIEAQKAGFDVEKSLIETQLAYLNNRLSRRETVNYYYNRDQQRKIAPKEVAYTLYVLALAGRPNISVMNYYKANRKVLSLDSRYLLSAAYAIAGDKSSYRELLPSAFSGEESVPQTGGSFYSNIRDEAIALQVLVDVEPSNAQIPIMAAHVINKLKQRTWYSTQESAFSLLALGKLARSSGKSTVTADVRVNGKLLGKVDAKAMSWKAAQLGGTSVDITTRGEGRLYYWWQSEGISVSGNYVEEDKFIKVRHKFFDRYGRLITGNTFRRSELVIVQIAVEKAYSGSLDNVVITGMLPAGFEIENPRTKEIPGMDWVKDAYTPLQLDVRDDRINLFVNLVDNRQTYYYAVRAVSPGVYRMGPVSADAMYNGEYHSYSGAATIRVTE